ncbi:MAG: hypothetical protein ABNH42_04275 [Marinobacter sp.]|jgi:hypothetical protein
MKARPILFNTDMVKAILAGQKTQTRRAVNADMAANFDEPRGTEDVLAGYPFVETEGGYVSALKLCPFGQPGDLLYVRETFRVFDSSAECACYDHCVCSRHNGKPMYFADGFCTKDDYKWNPSIHMPRWASRLTLEITDVRVERLQDIDRGDCMAEGCPFPNMAVNDPIGWFSGLWGSIYSNWDANPWVWVVEFKVHHCNVDALLRKREAA